jgi:hypothetical protein
MRVTRVLGAAVVGSHLARSRRMGADQHFVSTRSALAVAAHW